jgi:Glycosyl hydrolase catalytic core
MTRYGVIWLWGIVAGFCLGIALTLILCDVAHGSNRVGVNLAAVSDYRDDHAKRARVLDQLRSAGVRWLRIDVCGCELGHADYVAQTDIAFRQARRRGFKILAVVNGMPDRPLNLAPDPHEYAAMIGAAARRWRADAWEVWNEPDARAFWTGTPEHYGRLLAEAYPVIRATGALVIHAGLSDMKVDWLRRGLDAGARFDALALHPYPMTPDETAFDNSGADRALARIKRVRDFLVSRNDYRPIWITETGWTTGLGGVTPEQQAINTADMVQLVMQRYPFVARLFFYMAKEPFVPHDPGMDGLGLIRADFSEKPAFQVLRWLLGEKQAS